MAVREQFGQSSAKIAGLTLCLAWQWYQAVVAFALRPLPAEHAVKKSQKWTRKQLAVESARERLPPLPWKKVHLVLTLGDQTILLSLSAASLHLYRHEMFSRERGTPVNG